MARSAELVGSATFLPTSPPRETAFLVAGSVVVVRQALRVHVGRRLGGGLLARVVDARQVALPPDARRWGSPPRRRPGPARRSPPTNSLRTVFLRSTMPDQRLSPRDVTNAPTRARACRRCATSQEQAACRRRQPRDPGVVGEVGVASVGAVGVADDGVVRRVLVARGVDAGVELVGLAHEVLTLGLGLRRALLARAASASAPRPRRGRAGPLPRLRWTSRSASVTSSRARRRPRCGARSASRARRSWLRLRSQHGHDCCDEQQATAITISTMIAVSDMMSSLLGLRHPVPRRSTHARARTHVSARARSPRTGTSATAASGKSAVSANIAP